MGCFKSDPPSIDEFKKLFPIANHRALEKIGGLKGSGLTYRDTSTNIIYMFRSGSWVQMIG